MMTIDEMIAVLQAAKAGKQLQGKDIACSEWHNINNPLWNFSRFDYRVKPEPREWTVPVQSLNHWHAYSATERIRVREVLP